MASSYRVFSYPVNNLPKDCLTFTKRKLKWKVLRELSHATRLVNCRAKSQTHIYTFLKFKSILLQHISCGRPLPSERHLSWCLYSFLSRNRQRWARHAFLHPHSHFWPRQHLMPHWKIKVLPATLVLPQTRQGAGWPSTLPPHHLGTRHFPLSETPGPLQRPVLPLTLQSCSSEVTLQKGRIWVWTPWNFPLDYYGSNLIHLESGASPSPPSYSSGKWSQFFSTFLSI